MYVGPRLLVRNTRKRPKMRGKSLIRVAHFDRIKMAFKLYRHRSIARRKSGTALGPRLVANLRPEAIPAPGARITGAKA